MRIAVEHNNITDAMRRLRKKLRLENEDHYSKLRAIPKPSERRKAKERTAIARRRNQLKREGSRSGDRNTGNHQDRY